VNETRKELDDATKLAFERTWLAEERTLQAWVRTATSLITFGFAIYSFFAMPTGAGYTLTTRVDARAFSVALIAMGLLALLAATLQRRQAAKIMKSRYPELTRFSLGELIGGLIGCLGLFALAVALFHFRS